MTNSPKQSSSKVDSDTKNLQRKLYVAYLNEVMMGSYSKDQHTPSVFSSTSGSYYINGVPAILSMDEEMMLYDGQLSEYY
jgi:hypothetical protein